MEQKKELVWVEEEFAIKYKEAEKEESKREERLKIFNEYIEKVKKESRDEFKANLESMEEEAAIYSGLMLKVKQTFEKAKNEQLDASYKLWEKFEKEIPSIEKKVDNIILTLKPLQQKIETINELFGKIQTWNIEKLGEAIRSVAGLYGENKEMVKFLVTNYKTKKEK